MLSKKVSGVLSLIVLVVSIMMASSTFTGDDRSLISLSILYLNGCDAGPSTLWDQVPVF